MVDVPEIAAPSQMVPRHSVVFPLFLSFLFFFFPIIFIDRPAISRIGFFSTYPAI
jgi:hypothetical protein